MGGLSRKYTAVNTLRSGGVDPIILDAGDLLFPANKINKSNYKSEIFRASTILNGFEKIGCDVVNVGQYEFASGYKQLRDLISSTSIPFISANLIDSKTKKLIFKPYKLIKRGGITFGVIGVTDLVPDSINGVTIDDYEIAGSSYLKAMRDKVDVTILLVNSARSTYKDLPRTFSDADIIFTSGSTFLTRPMMNQREEGPYVFSCGREGRYLNQVDVSLVDRTSTIINRSYYEAKITYLNKRMDRYRDKDPSVPIAKLYEDQPAILDMIDTGRKDVLKMKNILSKRSNSIQFQNISMDSGVSDDPNILEYINDALDKYSKMVDGQ